jgi:hypothetical protein
MDGITARWGFAQLKVYNAPPQVDIYKSINLSIHDIYPYSSAFKDIHTYLWSAGIQGNNGGNRPRPAPNPGQSKPKPKPTKEGGRESERIKEPKTKEFYLMPICWASV